MSRHGIPDRESLHVEFKSDAKRLPDSELVLAAVCLANTEGGVIYLGVEDDGTITGLRPDHQDTTGIAVLIANKTVPPLSVRSSLLEVAGKKIAKVEARVKEQLGNLLLRKVLDAPHIEVIVGSGEVRERAQEGAAVRISLRFSEDSMEILTDQDDLAPAKLMPE